MKKMFAIPLLLTITLAFYRPENSKSWIRINQLGYKPLGSKVAVWCSQDNNPVSSFQLIDSATQQPVFKANASRDFGSYGPFTHTARLNFTAFHTPGVYRLQAGETFSPYFRINDHVYDGTADFCLQYMRQQRSGFNPFLNDSCHTDDGYTLDGPMPDSTHINVVGGWHDASDYLQYATTSANATYHLLAAYRDFPGNFSDEKRGNGLDGKNGLADVLDEAQWGIDWLLKMHPRHDWMFNQIADDRDHISMRLPKLDSQYGRGYERPVYFISGRPQQQGKFMNHTKGTSSTAAKFGAAFALAHQLWLTDTAFHRHSSRPGYYDKAITAFEYATQKPGVTQTVSVRSPYIYAEENWVDDMELATAAIASIAKDRSENWLERSLHYAEQEKITPWLGADTASHYQWYELAKQLKAKKEGNHFPDKVLDAKADSVINWYRKGIQNVWSLARGNAFYRGIPYIWCSNNLTTAFAIQCYWYRRLTNDSGFDELAQANVDWLFGCNPWGTSMVYGLPANGDTPEDPHSAFTHIGHYPVNGGLVDGPVYTSIYNNLVGIQLFHDDAYAAFQSNLAVYHDDYGDYSTNEPTMDGTASLIYLLAACREGFGR